MLVHGAFGSGDKTAYDTWAMTVSTKASGGYNINYRLECLPGQPAEPVRRPSAVHGRQVPGRAERHGHRRRVGAYYSPTYQGDPDMLAVMV